MRQLLRNRQIMLFDHSGDERTPEIVGHDLYPDLCTALAGDVIDCVFGDAFAGDVAATADAIEQKPVIAFTFLEL